MFRGPRVGYIWLKASVYLQIYCPQHQNSDILAFFRSRAMRLLEVDQLCVLLKHALGRMKTVSGVDPFTKPVDPNDFPSYKDYITCPMDLVNNADFFYSTIPYTRLKIVSLPISSLFAQMLFFGFKLVIIRFSVGNIMPGFYCGTQYIKQLYSIKIDLTLSLIMNFSLNPAHKNRRLFQPSRRGSFDPQYFKCFVKLLIRNKFQVQPNSVITNSMGLGKFVRYKRGSL